MKRLLALLLGAATLAFASPDERTLSIIKPDAVEHQKIGEITQYLEQAGLKVVAARMVRLTPKEAQAFYSAHKTKPFYKDLVAYMTSGPILAQVLQGPDAIAANRTIMGATDPAKAAPGTIRADFGTDIQHNAVHGSDSPAAAKTEIAFFFTPEQIF